MFYLEDTSIKDLTDTLHSYYSKSQYKEAIEFLKKNSDSINPEIYHYNVGVFYAKSNNWVSARLHFEKAGKEGFLGYELENNLKVTKQNLGINSIESSSSFQISEALYQAPTQLFVVITLIALITAFATMMKIKKTWLRVIIICFCFSPLAIKSIYLGQKSYIVTSDALVYDGPSKNIFEEIQNIPQGIKIRASKKKKDWFFIRYPESFSGWINASSLKRI